MSIVSFNTLYIIIYEPVSFFVLMTYLRMYKIQVTEEVPNKNYFSLVWAMPKYVNAFWELSRGFILPYWKGKEYREEHIEKLFRMVGMIIPGLSAHGPKDYIDVTRLGTDLVPTMNNDEEVVQKKD